MLRAEMQQVKEIARAIAKKEINIAMAKFKEEIEKKNKPNPVIATIKKKEKADGKL